MNDLKFAFRQLLKNPGFTAVAVLTLALGIGGNAAIFAVVNAVLLEPLPFAAADRLVSVRETRPEAGGKGQRVDVPVSPATFIDWRNEVRSFEQIAAISVGEFVHTGGAEPEALTGAFISANLFPMLGVTPMIGRGFQPEEDRPGAAEVVLLGHGLWQRRFGADTSVIGRAITLDGRPRTIIGVLPKWFDGVTAAGIAHSLRPEVWMPLGLPESSTERAVPAFTVHARLAPGATLAAAQAELDAIMQRLAKAFPETNATRGALVKPLVERVVSNLRPTLWLLFAAVGLVLFIACANVANLLLARATHRRAETALRAALGAGRGRLVRQFLTESALLATAGCAVGLVVAAVSVEVISAFMASSVPRAERIAIDGPVVSFTVVVALLTCVAFGLAPAWSSARTDLQTALKTLGRSGSAGGGGARVRTALVVTQVALSLVLLVGAGLLLKSFVALSGIDPGFDPRNVITLRVMLPEGKYPKPEKKSAFFEQLLPQLQALPGVESAAAVFPLPFSAAILNRPFTLPGEPVDPAAPLAAQYNIVTPEFFSAFRIRLTQGRGFTERDRPGAPLVAMVNETMARRIWPGENPIGKRLVIGLGRGAEREVVGVFADIRQRQLDAEPRLQVCVPHQHEPVRGMFLAVRGNARANTLLTSIRQRIAALDPDQPVSDVAELSERVSGSIAQRRFAMWLLAVFAATALLLAVVGLYGVLAYTVAQRTREIGIRVALGAQRFDVLRLVVGQGLRLALAGVVLGLAGAVALTRVLQHLLFEVKPTDPFTFGCVSIFLLTVALLACWLPARRAAKVDPMEALRTE